MKKALALVATFAMALSLAACGGASSSSVATSVDASSAGSSSAATASSNMTVIWWGNQVRNEGTQAALDLYESQNPGLTIDAQFAEWSDYWTRLATASAAHNLPDVVQMDYKYLSQYVQNGLLVDLNPYVKSGALDVSGIDPGILEAGSIDGGLYAVCIGLNAPSLIYNKTLLDEHGITVKDNLTLDEFIALSREIYEKTGVRTDVSYGGGENYIDYHMRSLGIELYDGNKFGAQSYEDFVSYFEIYENGIEEGWLCRPEIYAERTLGSVEQSPLVYGSNGEQRSWCAFAYSNQLAAFETAASAESLTLGITTWPSNDPAASNYLKPGQFFSVTTDSADPEAAAKLIDFWTNSLDCNEILLAERGVPAAAATADALAPSLNATQQRIVAYLNEVVTPNCSAISPPAPDSSAEVLKLYDSLQEQVCYGQLTAEQAAQKLFDEGNAILAG